MRGDFEHGKETSIDNEDGVIMAGYSSGTVSGGDYVGGLVGWNANSGNITTSYSTGTVARNKDVGGLVGSNDGSIIMSFWDVEASGQPTSAGGTGLTAAEMQDIDIFLTEGWDFVDEVVNGTCDYWQVSPGDYPRLRCHAGDSPAMPGGLGTPAEPYLIRDARDLGTVWFEPGAHYRLETSVDLSGIKWSVAVVPWFEGTFDGNGRVISNLYIQGAGHLGLFGYSTGEISNLGLEAVDVHGTGDNVGGLVGINWGNITTSYSAGAVSGNDAVGGLVGNDNEGNIAMSFWDIQTSGQITSAAGTGLTTAEMQTASTFLCRRATYRHRY